MKIAIILDWVMSIMLIISITYSWRLNKKFMDFKNNKGEFFKLIKVLDETILRAEASIEELKNLTLISSGSLGTKLDQIKILTDDLAFMSDRASVLADKLEESISTARKYENVNRNNYDFPSTRDHHHAPVATPIGNNSSPKREEPKKAAIESLLAKISAVKNKRESVDS
ncbi:MAG: DUF6468 domain-containing protein [Alphaproteobacteria bacterium]